MVEKFKELLPLIPLPLNVSLFFISDSKTSTPPTNCFDHTIRPVCLLLVFSPMQIMLSRLAVYARNKHLIVNTSKSEVVHFNSLVKMFLLLMLAVPPFITNLF